MFMRSERRVQLLAKRVVDGWDKKTLVAFAYDHLEAHYDEDVEDFERDWNSVFGQGATNE